MYYVHYIVQCTYYHDKDQNFLEDVRLPVGDFGEASTHHFVPKLLTASL